MARGSAGRRVCVAKRRKGPGEAGDLERNVDTLGLVEGDTQWYFM